MIEQNVNIQSVGEVAGLGAGTAGVGRFALTELSCGPAALPALPFFFVVLFLDFCFDIR